MDPLLKINEIPTEEPSISVGIILPEDKKKKLQILFPDISGYSLFIDNKNKEIISNSELIFELSSNKISCKFDRKVLRSQSIQITAGNDEIAPQYGIKIIDVPAGRSFHWKKEINITLPGSITIKQHDGYLILINHLPLEKYLMCVATSEMSETCPTALIEAQTVAARSWILANAEQKHRHLGMDVCNDDCCQRYQGTSFLSQSSIDGALKTYGQVLMYDDQICDARYSKSCGGVTESFDALWDGPPHPYLAVVTDIIPENTIPVSDLSREDNFNKWVHDVPLVFCSPEYVHESDLQKYLGSVDENGKYFRWEVSVEHDELVDHIRKLHSLDIKSVRRIEVINRAASGRINKLSIEWQNSIGKMKSLRLESEYAIRETLHPGFLYSSAIIIAEIYGNDDFPAKFNFSGAGWGHGAGMCQIGALGMAAHGYNSDKILMHYYRGSEIRKIYAK